MGEGGGHEEGRHEKGGCHEVDEGEEGERRRQGQGSQGARLLREEGQDAIRAHQGQADEEQAREGRVEGGIRERQEEVGEERLEGLVGGREKGAEGARIDGLRGDRGQVSGRQGPLREGEVLALSSTCSSCMGRFARCGSAGTSVPEAWWGLLPWFSRGMAAMLGLPWARCTRILQSHPEAEQEQ